MSLAVSVTTKLTVRLSRLTLPVLTRPPMRKVRFLGASPEATCVGVKKKTRLLWKALSTR